MMAMQQQQNQMNQQTPQNQQKTLTNGCLVCTMKVLLCLCRVSSLKSIQSIVVHRDSMMTSVLLR